MQVERLAASLGARVQGVRLAEAGAPEIEKISALLTEHLVLFFPEQFLTPEQHLALARHFGPLEGHPHLSNPSSGLPEIFELAATQGGIADEWHSDITFQAEPSVMAFLNMVECPSVGGDTMWANMYTAYEALSAPMRDLCLGLSAVHDATAHGRPEKRAIHPVVRVHPETGKRSLFVNEHFTRRIVELSHEESEVLLGHLTRFVRQPRFTVRYRWTRGTLAVWDNRCTQHFVINDFEGERVIQRATVMGDRPEAAEPPRWEPYVRGANKSATSRYDATLRAALRERERNS